MKNSKFNLSSLTLFLVAIFLFLSMFPVPIPIVEEGAANGSCIDSKGIYLLLMVAAIAANIVIRLRGKKHNE